MKIILWDLVTESGNLWVYKYHVYEFIRPHNTWDHIVMWIKVNILQKMIHKKFLVRKHMMKNTISKN